MNGTADVITESASGTHFNPEWLYGNICKTHVGIVPAFLVIPECHAFQAISLRRSRSDFNISQCPLSIEHSGLTRILVVEAVSSVKQIRIH